MESVTESGLLSLLCCQRFHWFQVEIVVEMEVVQVLTMDQEVQHVVSLPAYLKHKQHCFIIMYQSIIYLIQFSTGFSKDLGQEGNEF